MKTNKKEVNSPQAMYQKLSRIELKSITGGTTSLVCVSDQDCIDQLGEGWFCDNSISQCVFGG